MQANEFHIKAEELREWDKLNQALEALDLSLKDYEENQNYEGFVQALQSRILTYKHLFLLSQDKKFLELARSDAGKALGIALQKNITSMLGSSYFHLGEISMLNKDFKSAADYYQQALKNFVGTDCERGDYKYHLGEALYKLGQEAKGLKLLQAGLNEIHENRNQVEPFLADVWESGCLMKLAEILENESPARAKKYLQEAQKIINSNQRLIIRKRQLLAFKKKLSSGWLG